MKWNHLPVAGGIYDQDPELVRKFQTIFSVRSEEEARKQREEERKGKNKGGAGGRRR